MKSKLFLLLVLLFSCNLYAIEPLNDKGELIQITQTEATNSIRVIIILIVILLLFRIITVTLRK